MATKRAYKLRILANSFPVFLTSIFCIFFRGTLCLFDRSIATVAFILLAGRFSSSNLTHHFIMLLSRLPLVKIMGDLVFARFYHLSCCWSLVSSDRGYVWLSDKWDYCCFVLMNCLKIATWFIWGWFCGWTCDIGMPWLAFGVEEFVAHSSNVNCLKIGRKTSRVLVTGGDDHKVNLWAIGKPNSILVSLYCPVLTSMPTM